jgi:hypothetical protein
MDFPKWAPKELCDLYNNWGKLELPENFKKALSSTMETSKCSEQRLELLKRLLTRDEMRSVWNAFAQMPIVCSDTNVPLPPEGVMFSPTFRLYYPPESYPRREMIQEFVGYSYLHPTTGEREHVVADSDKIKGCIYCYDHSGGKVWEKRFGAIMVRYEQSGMVLPTRSEIIARLKRIAKSASEMSRAIKNTPFDTSPLEWVDENEWLEVPGGGLTSNRAFATYYMCDNCRKLREQEPPQNTWGSPALGSFGANMSTIMKRIADEAKEELKLYQGETEEQPALYILKPGADNARANYFIRAMSIYFEKVFGSPRYELLADLATVALEPHLDEGETISESTVASSLKEWRKTLRKNK